MRVDDPDVASLDDVREAIERLTTADLLRLQSFARWRMGALGLLARGRDSTDLLQEALAATLDPARRTWRKGTVDFPYHLRMAIQSISDGWKTRRDFTETLGPDLYRLDPTEPSEATEDPLGTAAAAGRPVREEEDVRVREVLAGEAIDALEKAIADDATAAQVLGGMRAGMPGPDIKEALDISETELQTARRKIARHAKSLQATFGHTTRKGKE